MRENRRIQLTGGSTYIISLPKRWVLNNKLGKGDQVILVYDGKRMVVTPIMKDEALEIKMNVDGNEDIKSVTRQIISYYLAGYDVIKVFFKELNEDLRVAIKKVIRKKMIGFEVTDESSDFIEIRSLMRHGELSLSSAINRLFELVNLILNNVISILRDFNKRDAKNIIIQDDDVDRLYLYTVRTIRHRISYPILEDETIEPYQYVILNMIVKALERIADHVVRIAYIVKEINVKPPDKVLEGILSLLWIASEIFLSAKNAFINRDIKLANAVINNVKRVVLHENKLVNILERSRPSVHTAILCRIMIESIRRISEYAADIGEMTVDLSIIPPRYI